MLQHATIFYIKPNGPYVLCYDDDLEKQKSPKRSWYSKGTRIRGNRVFPNIIAFKPIKWKDHLTMRAIYNPVKTEFSRRADGYVDRVIVIDADWLHRCSLQFKVAFPAGLQPTLIEKFNPPELV